jgi:hypothetical protein
MMLAGSAHEASSLFTTPADERWYEEFLVALRAGMFGKRRSTRVLLLNPYKPFSPWRLTTDAERAIERCGYQSFVEHYAAHAWIEIDLAHGWLASWLNPWVFQEWRSLPRVWDTLAARAPARVGPEPGRQAQPLPSAQPSRPVTNDEDDAVGWFRQTAADMVRRGERLTKDQAFALAVEKFGSGLSQRTFYHRVWATAAPNEWKAKGRPKSIQVKN